ncbi:MAG TPA: DUF2993 domain-containing protein [Chroococcales cyanobacterium]
MPEKVGFPEQAVNKIVEMAIASQLQKADGLEVRIKTDLNKLAHGQLDSLAIAIYGVLLQPNLEAETLQLEIGRVTVKPLKALRGKITLVHPSEGTFRLVINEESFITALNTELLKETLRSRGYTDNRDVRIRCLLSDNTITFSTEPIGNNTEVPQHFVLVATPEIAPEGQAVLLQQVRYVEGQEPSPEFTSALLARMYELLSLQDFERQGMLLQIQQLDVTQGKLTLDAAAHIEQFPSS